MHDLTPPIRSQALTTWSSGAPCLDRRVLHNCTTFGHYCILLILVYCPISVKAELCTCDPRKPADRVGLCVKLTAYPRFMPSYFPFGQRTLTASSTFQLVDSSPHQDYWIGVCNTSHISRDNHVAAIGEYALAADAVSVMYEHADLSD